MNGDIHNITNVNFQEDVNAIINPAIIWETICKICANLSPPNSICSSWACTFVANSNALFASNHPCSCFKIVRKYFL